MLRTKIQIYTALLGMAALMGCGTDQDMAASGKSLFLSGCYGVTMNPPLVVYTGFTYTSISNLVLYLNQDGAGNIAGDLISMTVDGLPWGSWSNPLNKGISGQMLYYNRFRITIASMSIWGVDLNFELEGDAAADTLRQDAFIASDIQGLFITPLFGFGTDFFGLLDAPSFCQGS